MMDNEAFDILDKDVYFRDAPKTEDLSQLAASTVEAATSTIKLYDPKFCGWTISEDMGAFCRGFGCMCI
ncbi:hypothetical protein BEWA_026780 [Theileria equi strain WA]|uniref:Uncharacterized protein n=1 Tax=Theileria equi strain WA TaxID=1537102 RepID=L0AY44_THEEQ|nr:hypothetical protein BEWA_026780 [Theileria equi strain WA]AFZ79829.1 hypothetical protein BEWA_026780 [Theileria equi strain WA]|eukprot:XP_004829495.1 hypothetical protein BEWA_026780 [Theileria equi strain WA]